MREISKTFGRRSSSARFIEFILDSRRLKSIIILYCNARIARWHNVYFLEYLIASDPFYSGTSMRPRINKSNIRKIITTENRKTVVAFEIQNMRVFSQGARYYHVMCNTLRVRRRVVSVVKL